jgi:hypothetical protein
LVNNLIDWTAYWVYLEVIKIGTNIHRII